MALRWRVREAAVQTAARSTVTATISTPFGRSLRHWRRVRGVSQLELSLLAQTTTRHLSYLETGRSRPSADMVDRLGDALSIPLRERNRLLEQSGLAPAYPEGDLTTEDLAPFRRAIERLLASHDPFPGFVLDRHWNIIGTNRAAEAFLNGSEQRNTIELVLGTWRPMIDNWADIAPRLVDRLAADLSTFPDDSVLRDLYDRATSGLAGERGARGPTTASRVICPRFRIGEHLIDTITVAARFESAADITLDEVRVELMYPQDDVSERFFTDRLQGHRAEADLT
jgi:transcriptional regulator with XRE-family HTH domain